MTFTVGQKVVCVDATNSNGVDWGPGEEVIEGRVYTVRRAFVDDFGKNAVWLDEVARSPETRMILGEGVGYWAKRFRPLVSRQTDISVFHEILDEVSRRAPSTLEPVT